MTKEKKEKTYVWSPTGRISYPYLADIDQGRQYSSKGYRADLFIPKAAFSAKDGLELQAAVLKVGKDFFGDDYTLTSDKYRSPFKDTDLDDDLADEAQRGCIMIRAKASPWKGKDGKENPPRPPIVVGPDVDENGRGIKLGIDEIRKIKGGDKCRLQLYVFAYPLKYTVEKINGKEVVTQPFHGGVSFGLQMVQFGREGDSFGQGSSTLLKTVQGFEDDTDTVVA